MMTSTAVSNYLEHHDKFLRYVIESADIPAPRIREAILYALFPGGKRVRPLLVYYTGELLEVELPLLDIIAAAIELTHGYSLIHDDLPAMDNDDLRRGKPSCHRAFDEATAILAGDGMQALAIDLLLTRLPAFLPFEKVITVTQLLVNAMGPAGMVSGQSLDLSELGNEEMTVSSLEEIHRLKTGKMIAACIEMVSASSSNRNESSHALRQFAYHLGLLFQMQDDYLDQYGVMFLGKNRRSDEANEKKTFARLYTQDHLRVEIERLHHQAHTELSLFGDKAQRFSQLLNELWERVN